MRPLKILIKRDTINNFKTENYVPRLFELVTAYETGSKNIIYKLGDGKTSFVDLPEIKKISELDHFSVYTGKNQKPAATLYLNPFSILEILDEQ